MQVITSHDCAADPLGERSARKAAEARRAWMDEIRAAKPSEVPDLIDQALEAEIGLAPTFLLNQLGRATGVRVEDLRRVGAAVDGIARVIEARLDGDVPMSSEEPEEPRPGPDAPLDERRAWDARQIEREREQLHAQLEDVDFWASHPADEQSLEATEQELSDRAGGWPADDGRLDDSRSERGWNE